MTRRLNLVGPGARVLGFFGANPTSDLLKIDVALPDITLPNNDVVVGNKEARNFSIRGFSEFGFAEGGNDAILVTDAGENVANIGLEICNCVIGVLPTSTGYAIRLVGVGTHTNNVIRSCQIDNGIYNAGADGLTVRECNIYGIKPGVTVNVVNGAYKTRIVDNEIVARDGGVVVIAGQQVDIERNQFEQFVNYGANQGSYGAHIALDGTLYNGTGGEEVRDIRIIGNNFGSGANQVSAIVLKDNTIDVLIDENVFANIGTSGFDVTIEEASCKWTRIGTRNRVYGIRGGVLRGVTNVKDPKTLLYVSDGGTGTYGFAARKTPALLANYTGSTDFCVWKDENDRVHIDGSIAIGSSANVAGGTIVFTLPEGMRPATPQVIILRNSVNASFTSFSIYTDGNVTVDANVNAGSSVFFGGASFTAVGRTSYLSGPY